MDKKPCSNCKRLYAPLRKGRCAACYDYFRATGKEREPKIRITGLANCIICNELYQPLRRGRCQKCYDYLLKNGIERPDILRDECPQCGYPKSIKAALCGLCSNPDPEEKACTKCKTVYPINDYNFRPNGRGGYKRRSVCKACESRESGIYAKNNRPKINEKKRAYHKKKPHVVRRWALRSRWKRLGYNPETIESYIRSHNRKCDICGSKPENKSLSIDHDHKTGELRGILCSNCNAGLGQFKDNPEIIKNAIRYLKKCKERPTGIFPTSGTGLGPVCGGRE